MKEQQSGRTTPPPRRKAQGARPSSQQRRASRSAPKRRPSWIKPAVAVAILAVVAVVVVVATSGGGATKSPALNYRAGTLAVYGGKGPEGIPVEMSPVLAPASPALSGAAIDGVQCGAKEQLTSHTHTHLQVFVDGAPRAVPLAVGMVPPAVVQSTANGQYAQGSNTCLYWMHTHAQDGIVHVEAPAARQFVLGQFFDIWGQPLSPTQVGPAHGAVTVTVEGHPYSGDPRNAPLDNHGQIVINVGTPIVTPPPVSYSGSGL